MYWICARKGNATWQFMRTELDARKHSNDFLNIMDKSQVLEREEHVAEHFSAIQYIETSKDIKCVSVQIAVQHLYKNPKRQFCFSIQIFSSRRQLRLHSHSYRYNFNITVDQRF